MKEKNALNVWSLAFHTQCIASLWMTYLFFSGIQNAIQGIKYAKIAGVSTLSFVYNIIILIFGLLICYSVTAWSYKKSKLPNHIKS